ncbi:hypothetical protein FOZ62_003396 [Perkinsus olseni]|uniref:Uncharacterized protein n=1 Tax=Perkinsus olseni TaxID=32597 RepID=A0A7J6SC68_PEROL|nr:hypothetical protein FOZ62_003396 [Perkinsus olseni]
MLHPRGSPISSLATLFLLAQAAGRGVHVRFIPLGDILGGGGPSSMEGHPHQPLSSPPIPLDDINKLFPMHGSMGPGDGIMDSLLSHILDDLGHGANPSPLGGDEPHFFKKLIMKNGPPPDDPCEKDVARLCPKEPSVGKTDITVGMQKSRLHCLGLRAQEVSKNCVKSVEKSLPFVCAVSISQYCGTEDTMERGVLACLSEQVEKGKEMGSLCRESVRATRVVIDLAKNSKGVATVMKGDQHSVLSRVRGSMTVPTTNSPSLLGTFAFMIVLITAALLGAVAWEEGPAVAAGRFLTSPGATLGHGATKLRTAFGNSSLFGKSDRRSGGVSNEWDGFEFDEGPPANSGSYGAAAE